MWGIIVSMTDTYFKERMERPIRVASDSDLESELAFVEAHLKRFGSAGDFYQVIALTPVDITGYVGHGFIDSGWSTERIWVRDETIDSIREALRPTEVERFRWKGREYATN